MTLLLRFSRATTIFIVLLVTCHLLLVTSVDAQGLGPGPSGIKQLEQMITRVINISVGLAFMALTVVLVYAGIMYLTSGGDTKRLQNASMTVTWAFLGILFLVIAWLILRLIEAFTGVKVTQFNLCFPGSICP